jgi:hypothetical protein
LGSPFRPFLKRFARNSVASSPAAGGIEAGSRQGAAGETIALAWRAFHLFREENSFREEDSSGRRILLGGGFFWEDSSTRTGTFSSSPAVR